MVKWIVTEISNCTNPRVLYRLSRLWIEGVEWDNRSTIDRSVLCEKIAQPFRDPVRMLTNGVEL